MIVTLQSPHPRAPTHPSTPKVLWARECAPNAIFFHYVHFRLTFESIKELGSASSMIKDNIGKDLNKVYLPMYFNELISSL